MDDAIRHGAHEIDEARGSGPGGNIDDWLAAERELRGDK
jgi:hypothetical protein